jgi:predicted HicB family RNase H-like nuclease
MPVSKAQKKATAKYEQQNYDKVLLRLEKGKKDIIKNHTEQSGESLNGFINRAIDETMQRDTAE